MGFNHTDLTSHKFAESRQDFTARDNILYALGLGVGSEPTNAGHLQFVYEKGLRTLPTIGVVLAHPGFWAGIPELGIDWVKMLHVGQGLTIHQPIPTAASVIGRSRIADVIDRGADKGAILFYERDVIDSATGSLMATVRQTLLCRGNGGFSTATGTAPEAPKLPERAPDHISETTTLPQMALLYRLSGDMNPLHADPAVAAKAGFTRPILHGLATFGVAGFALISGLLNYDVEKFRSMDVRFTAPVYPGETIRTEFWQKDAETILFRASVTARDKTVLDNGICRVAA
jgi:acyl dehydratase